MKSTIEIPNTHYALTNAVEIAASHEATDEDGWTYTVIDHKNGFASIAIYDENNEFVGYL